MPETNCRRIKPPFATIQTLLACDSFWGRLIHVPVRRGPVQETIKTGDLRSYRRHDSRTQHQSTKDDRGHPPRSSVTFPYIHAFGSSLNARALVGNIQKKLLRNI